MLPTSRTPRETVPNISRASSAQRKHEKEATQESAASVILNKQATARTGRPNSVYSRRVHLANSGIDDDDDGDDDDGASLLASFQQGRLGDKVQAERQNDQLTDDPIPSSHGIPSQSQPQSHQNTTDSSSSEVPDSGKKLGRRPKQQGGRRPRPGARCDTCIIQRRACDGVRPVCGRCVDLSRECEWHEEAISRAELERRKEAASEAMKPTKRVQSEISGGYGVESRPATASRSGGEATDKIAHRIRLDNQIASLKAQEDAFRAFTNSPDLVPDQSGRSAILHAAVTEPDVNPWTYEDHLEMLETISESRVSSVRGREVVGHKKANQIFENATKAFEDFDSLDDLDKSVPRLRKYDSLVLNWDGREGVSKVIPNAAWDSGGECVPSNLRRRIGLLECPIPSVEVPRVQEEATAARMEPQPYDGHDMRLASLGRNECSSSDDWMKKPRRHGVNWNDGGGLPRPDEAPRFCLDANMVD